MNRSKISNKKSGGKTNKLPTQLNKEIQMTFFLLKDDFVIFYGRIEKTINLKNAHMG